VNSQEFIEGIRRKVIDERGKNGTDAQLAEHLGITLQALYNWRNRDEITVRQMVGLLVKFEKKAVERTQKAAIQPIVEFFELAPADSRNGLQIEIFGTQDEEGKVYPYLKGLRDQLRAHHGIYVFYDSRGRALYAGKARQQTLWREINNAFNRDRPVQRIRRVDHPEQRRDFRTLDEVRRQIRLRSVLLHDLAKYVSAYKVADGLITELESLLIRGFPNDLLNVRMENFNWERK
jgi:hypothetical protein